MIIKRKWLYVCCLLIGIVFLGCGGPKVVMKPADIQVFVDDARSSVNLAKEAEADQLAPEQMIRAEALLARAEESAKDEKRGAESIRLASEAKARAEAAYAVSGQKKMHQQEMEKLSTENAANLAALRIAQEVARESEKQKIRELQECSGKLVQLRREKDLEVTALRDDLETAEDRLASSERDLREARSRWENAKEELEEAIEESQKQSERTALMEAELADARAALQAAEGDNRKVETKVKAYSERVAVLEREKDKKIAIHVAREEAAQKSAAKVRAREETLQGKASLETLQEVRRALEGWRLAWERKDPDRYISYYSDQAVLKKLTIAQGREEEQELSKSQMRKEMQDFFARGVEFSMEGPELEAGSQAVRATYEFFKELPPDAYENREDIIKHDKWVKQLLFREVDGKWKIVREDWKIYLSIPEYLER